MNTHNGKTMRNSEELTISEYLDKIGEYALLSVEEEQELLSKVVNGNEEALNKILCVNRRFIVNIASQYQNRGLSLLQLVDVSSQGLANAARKSLLRHHNKKFIQFAVPFMRKAIEEAIVAPKEK